MDLDEDMVAVKTTANTRAARVPLAAGKVFKIGEPLSDEKGAPALTREDAKKLVSAQKAQAISKEALGGVEKDAAAEAKKADADAKKDGK